jgi:NADH:ubiquinone oxidoreductase subunit D
LRNDVRLSKSDVYSFYNKINIKSFISINGDAFDRYLIRMLEMVESLNIINNIVMKICFNKNNCIEYSNLIFNKNINISKFFNTSMEDLISHFLL